MKKLTLLLLMVTSFVIAQTKTTGVVTLNANMTAKIDLNQTTSTATITITNPSTSWFGLGFNTVVGVSGMPALVDCVVMRSATNLSDSQTKSPVATGNPNIDAIQNWTVVSNVDTGGTKTIVATRAFNTGDTADYVFNYADTSLNLIYASPNSGTFSVLGHGGSAGAGFKNAPMSVLGVEDFSLKASSIYPNPSNGTFRIQTKTDLTKVNVYGQTGNFIKKIEVKDNSQDVEVNLKGVAKGIYLLELQNETDKSWKKIIVE
jgi:Secretion system C-terminal sorting domain